MHIRLVTKGLQTNSYQINGMVYRHAILEDNKLLKKTLRDNPMDSWVNMAFEREPNYFAGESLMGKTVTVIAHEQHNSRAIAGMYSVSLMPTHINGVASVAGYLANLRANPEYRNKLRFIKGGFHSITKLIPDYPPVNFTSVATQNTKARRLLEASLSKMPRYNIIGKMQTLAIASNKYRCYGMCKPLCDSDISNLVHFYNNHARKFQFSPVLTETWLKQNKTVKFYVFRTRQTIKACFAIWDQRSIKQTVIKSYRFPLNYLRAVYNIYARLGGRVLLPAANKQLEQAYLAFFAYNDSISTKELTKVFHDALYYLQQKGIKIGVIGLASSSPILQLLTKSFHPRTYETLIQTVTMPDDKMPRLANLPAQPEIAVL